MDTSSAGAAAASLTEQVANTAEEATGISLKMISAQTLFNAALTFGICLLVILIVLKIIDHVQKLSTMDATLKSFIRSTVKACLWIITIGTVLAALGVDPKSFTAIVGIVGLALSLSLQSTLANLFSGMTILTTKPFTAGDYVQIDEADGLIMQVELFYTSMLTFDNRTIFIPNSQVTQAKIMNYSREPIRRVDIVLGLNYDARAALVKETFLALVGGDARVLKDPAAEVVVLSLQDSAMQYALRAWVKTDDYWDVLHDLNAAIPSVFAEKGISITYNHLNVHILDEKKN